MTSPTLRFPSRAGREKGRHRYLMSGKEVFNIAVHLRAPSPLAPAVPVSPPSVPSAPFSPSSPSPPCGPSSQVAPAFVAAAGAGIASWVASVALFAATAEPRVPHVSSSVRWETVSVDFIFLFLGAIMIDHGQDSGGSCALWRSYAENVDSAR